MRETFRLSMAYLHTWLGLLLGFVLMAVFFIKRIRVLGEKNNYVTIGDFTAFSAEKSRDTPIDSPTPG